MQQIKNNKQKQTILLLAGIIILQILMLLRCFYDIETLDEAYYLAETRLVLNGAVPYAFNNQSSSGFTFLILPFLKVYQLICPALEGVFLYMRICFWAWRLILWIITYIVLKKHFAKDRLLLAILILTPFWGIFVPAFSYNTISMWLIFLVGVINIAALNEHEQKNIYLDAVISGILMALAVFAHPAQALNVFLVGVLLLYYTKKKKIQTIILYALSGISVVGVVLCIAMQAGTDHLMNGLEIIFGGEPALAPVPIAAAIKHLLSQMKTMIIVMLVSIVICYLFCYFFKKDGLEHEKGKYYIINGLAAGTIVNLIISLVRDSADSYIGGSSILLSIGTVAFMWLLGFSIISMKTQDRLLYWFIMIPPLLLFVINGFFAWCDIYLRMSEFIFVLFGVILILPDYIQSDNLKHRVFHYGYYIIVFGTVFLLLKSDFGYVYLGEQWNKCTTQIESGIYKGMFTTKEKNKDITELEKYIHEITESDERILFRDIAPMAYLMSDGIACTPTAWDTIQYMFGGKDDRVMQLYFKNIDAVPDKIIYIDTEFVEGLSIESDDFPFNQFVNDNYSYVGERDFGEEYRVVCYEKND